MYPIILHIHDMLRWALLILFVIVIVKSFVGWFWEKKPGVKSDSIFGIVLTAAYDLQFLIGIVLYAFLSPLVKSSFC